MKKHFGLLLLASLILVSLAACSNSNSSLDQTGGHNRGVSETEPSIPPKVENEVVYLDHSQLGGDELELVKIANLAAEHQNGGDEQAYFSLFDSKRDPNMKMASHKITKMLLESVSVKGETSALIVALVTTVENGENTRLYTFVKENGKWNITDID